ncbi:hypothetical protein PRZ48_005038 [Zasmidium cellare]|uniref:Zinc finger PHD-type domain-containing protein n=1 Tax=Zasmidium cellare TaxID=395010 RepID=A0ABR0ESE5_ZASCE|nr:hypothetical protein PRZ48_005038 [Zasmidium cellare]
MSSPVRFMADGKDKRNEQALREVQDFEGGGTVLNEWYTMAEYIKRRHGFLGKHPDHKVLPSLAVSARWDAELVFGMDSSAKLSVQEIRRRELNEEVNPLLPFPTTSNTQSLDNFASYPNEEWHPEVEFPPIPEGSPRAVLRTPTPVLSETDSPPPAQTNANHYAPVSRSNYFADTAASEMARFRAQGFVHPGFAQMMSQRQNFHGQDQQVRSFLPQQTAYSGLPPLPKFNSTDNPPRNPRQVRFATNDMAASVNVAGPPSYPINAHKMSIDPAIVAKVVDDLIHPPGSLKPSDAPVQYQPGWTGASSLAGRPVHGTVKSPANGKKRAAPDDDDPADRPRPDSARPDSDIDDQPQPDAASDREQTPAAKRPKLILKASPPKATSKATSSSRKKSTASSPVKRSSKANGKQPQRTITNDNESAASTSTAAPTTTDPLERIARGEILPKSKAQATAAASHRHALLLAAHKNKKRHPDFPPEFFARANFSKEDLANQNVVRCLCGATKDEKNPTRNRDWVGCDNEECGVWQHVDCIGEAVPKDLENDDYLCHMCDPFVHRRVLQGIRKDAVAKGEQ